MLCDREHPQNFKDAFEDVRFEAGMRDDRLSRGFKAIRC
jgi:hypothetical protein